MSGKKLTLKDTPAATQPAPIRREEPVNPNGFTAPETSAPLRMPFSIRLGVYLKNNGVFLLTALLVMCITWATLSGKVPILASISLRKPADSPPAKVEELPAEPSAEFISRQREQERIFASTAHRRRMAETLKKRFNKEMAELNRESKGVPDRLNCGSGGCSRPNPVMNSLNDQKRILLRDYRADLKKLDLHYSRQPEVMQCGLYRNWLNEFFCGKT